MICTRLLQAENRVEGLSHQAQLLEAIYKISIFFCFRSATHMNATVCEKEHLLVL